MAISACVWRCTSNKTSANVAFSARMRSIPFSKVTVTSGFGGGGGAALTTAGSGGAVVLETAGEILAAATFVRAAGVLATSEPAASEAFRSLAAGAAGTSGDLALAAETGP